MGLRVGSTGATASAWVADTLVLCAVASGVGAYHDVVVTLERATHSTLALITYDNSFAAGYSAF
eukprot:2797054-Rhodomonas_salina.1